MRTYVLKKWPNKVYPGEVDPTWSAGPVIDVFLNEVRKHGPAPLGYNTKHHGKKMLYIWQLNLKIKGRQIRVLYGQYDNIIVFLHFHKKSSAQEQRAGYKIAVERKKEVGVIMGRLGQGSNGLYSFN